ncbi:uncharacterized protein ACR2FA_009631 [Aphomia sociella]
MEPPPSTGPGVSASSSHALSANLCYLLRPPIHLTPRRLSPGSGHCSVAERNLAYPTELETLRYERIVKLLDEHFTPKRCSYADKAKFYGAIRSPGETLGDWAARLRGLASYCDFGDGLENILTDRFVLGLYTGPERDKLFEQDASKLTLARALELAVQAECARQAKAIMAKEGSPSIVKDEPIFRASNEGERGRGWGERRTAGTRPNHRTQNEPYRCGVCGMKNHNENECRFKSYKCNKCGKKGHLKKVCGMKNRYSRVNNLGEVDNEDEEDSICCKECHNYSLRYVTDKPIELCVNLGQKCITMELDSGSENGGPPLLGRDFMSAFEFILTKK